MLKEPIIFLHIPKVAGTTLLSIMQRVYRRDKVFIWRPRWSINENLQDLKTHQEQASYPRAIIGHFGYGLHQYLPQFGGYFTMLRHPVDLAISRYYYRRDRNLTSDYRDILTNHARSTSLIEFCQQTEDNPLTRFLSGQELQEQISLNSTQTSFRDLQLHHISNSPEPCSRELLEVAKTNLQENFLAFGLTERFDESLILFRHVLRWNNIYYIKKNVGQGTSARENLSSEVIQQIANTNSLDMELYEYAKTLFQARLDQLGESFRKELSGFRRFNPLLGNWNNIVDSVSPQLTRLKNKISLENFSRRLQWDGK